jgi:hypothetical protein
MAKRLYQHHDSGEIVRYLACLRPLSWNLATIKLIFLFDTGPIRSDAESASRVACRRLIQPHPGVHPAPLDYTLPMNEIHLDPPPSPFFICVEGNLVSDRVCLVGSCHSDMSAAKRTRQRAWEHYCHALRQAGIEDADLDQIKNELESAPRTLPRECHLTQTAISQLGFD